MQEVKEHLDQEEAEIFRSTMRPAGGPGGTRESNGRRGMRSSYNTVMYISENVMKNPLFYALT